MAKEIKGTLCLNNGKVNGGTWKTPNIDLALKNKQGYKGGETAQRFYTKFPIYRPRGPAPPDVQDNIAEVWKDQINAVPDTRPNFLVDPSAFRTTKNFSASRDDQESLRYKTNQRSNSIANDTNTKSMLRLAGRNTIQFPRRERFNEDTESVIAEQKQKKAAQKLTERHLGGGANGADDAQSRRTNMSKRSLSKSELTKFFKPEKKNQEDDTKSRFSRASRGSRASGTSGFKARFMQKMEDQNQENKQKREQQIAAAIEEHTYESD